MRANGAIRPTTGTANYNYGAAYSQWARRGYQGGAAMQGMQPYSRGAGTTAAMRRVGGSGVGAANFNPANPNGQQNAFLDQPAYDEDYGWMDFEETGSTMQRGGAADPASGLPANNTSNATNAQGYTGAVVPGADQVVAPGNAMAPTGQPMNQQPTEFRFYQHPLMDRAQGQQVPQPSGASGSGVAPTQSQQPNGVSDAATGGPIKY